MNAIYRFNKGLKTLFLLFSLALMGNKIFFHTLVLPICQTCFTIDLVELQMALGCLLLHKLHCCLFLVDCIPRICWTCDISIVVLSIVTLMIAFAAIKGSIMEDHHVVIIIMYVNFRCYWSGLCCTSVLGIEHGVLWL